MGKKVMVVFGTRPEAIKMGPLVKELEKDSRFEPIVVVTGQHRQMLDQVLTVFQIQPHYDLAIMAQGQTLTDITTKVLTAMAPILTAEKPDIVLVHGDTSTTFAAALAAFYQRIPIGHVEAGLRTWQKYSPYPEEMNRQMTDDLADLYFAPTKESRENLLKEHRSAAQIFVTGNTVIDTLSYTVEADYQPAFLKPEMRNIVLTTHRNENLGEPMEAIFQAVTRLVAEFPDVNLIFPIHKNPRVRQLAEEYLGDSPRIQVIEPLDFKDFHNVMAQSYLILSDSGGIQEEAPALGVPVLVLRDTTERPEGIAAGTLKLVGTDEEQIYQTAKLLLADPQEYEKMHIARNPYGDGQASQRIAGALAHFFQLEGAPLTEFE